MIAICKKWQSLFPIAFRLINWQLVHLLSCVVLSILLTKKLNHYCWNCKINSQSLTLVDSSLILFYCLLTRERKHILHQIQLISRPFHLYWFYGHVGAWALHSIASAKAPSIQIYSRHNKSNLKESKQVQRSWQPTNQKLSKGFQLTLWESPTFLFILMRLRLSSRHWWYMLVVASKEGLMGSS